MLFSIKNVWKNLMGKLDEYYKEQDEACMDWLVSDVGIYRFLEKRFGWIGSVKDAAGKLHDEQLLKKEEKNWNSIDKWLKTFKNLQDFSSLFENGYDHPYNGDPDHKFTLDRRIKKGNTLKTILLSKESVYGNKTLRPIMAAAMISNIKLGKGLYRGIADADNQGLWVRCLLGERHHKTYMTMRADVIAKIKAGAKDADQLQDRLKRSEVDYIVNNIRNANGGTDFGSVKDNNEQALKQLYGSQFAGELESAYNEAFGKAAIE